MDDILILVDPLRRADGGSTLGATTPRLGTGPRSPSAEPADNADAANGNDNSATAPGQRR